MGALERIEVSGVRLHVHNTPAAGAIGLVSNSAQRSATMILEF